MLVCASVEDVTEGLLKVVNMVTAIEVRGRLQNDAFLRSKLGLHEESLAVRWGAQVGSVGGSML